MVNPVAGQEVEKDFLAMLVCPATHQSLRLATAQELAKLKLDAALMREDGLVAYPICEGIPVLTADAAIQIS
jgi:uncharacterized protein YbaR (Trm112 family)